MALSFTDYVVFITYLVAVIVIGLWVARREKHGGDDYFLAGRTLPWYAIGFSMVASSISTEQFIGAVGFAYLHGMAVANWEWGIFPAITIMLVVFIPFYVRRQIRTMPEFLERRFGPSTRAIFAVISVLSYVFINLAGVLYAGGLALHAIFDVNLWMAICLLATVAGVYTIVGGLAAVVWTDILQAILLLGGGLLVFVLGVQEVEGGWGAIRGTGERAHLILAADHPELPWTGMLVLFFSTNIWYYSTNQYINQRVLAAKNEWHARAGMLFTAFLGLFLALAVCFPGMIARQLFPELADPDQAYPVVVSQLIGPLGYGIRGLVFAGLIGAIMSTIDSLVNSTSTILTLDVVKRFWRRDLSDAQIIRWGRVISGIVLAVGVAWTPVVGQWGSIFSYFQDCWVFLAVPITVVFVAALFWRRSNTPAASITLLLSPPMTLLPVLMKALDIEMNTFNLAGLLIIPVIAVHVLLALCTPAPAREQVVGWVWNWTMVKIRPPNSHTRDPWYKNLVLWWFVILLLYVGIYATFW